MIRFIQLIEYIIFSIIDVFVVSVNSYDRNTVLLIRLDAIGDYVLFRNFIEVLKKDEKYKSHEITLVGNIAWKKLAEELDSEYVDKFIWIDRKKFNRNLIYRFNKLNELTCNGYEIVISPVYSREFLIVDNIVKKVFAKDKVGSVGDLSNMQRWQKNKSDKYYTILVNARKEIMFEFNRNKEFFENFLGKDIDIKKQFINTDLQGLDFKLPNKYAILFIGASAKFRKWNIESFAQVGKYLKSKYGCEIVLSGASSDEYMVKDFERVFKGQYINIVGKTTLMQLLQVLKKGQILLSNETSAPHFAVGLNVENVFVISNGNHYGRFTPYPKSMCNNYHVINHPLIELNIDRYKYLSNTYGYGSDLDINEITVESVINKIDKVLQNDDK